MTCDMMTRNTLFLWIFFLFASQTLGARSLVEQFKQTGYVEISDKEHTEAAFDDLYACFDTLIAFLQKNPAWAQRLYGIKERFIRSKDRNYYSTDIFGFYDESKQEGRSQIAFYYSTHFHQFICSHYPEFNKVPEIIDFFEVCSRVQKPYENLCNEIATELGVETLFSSKCDHPPILLKVIKYLPSYIAARPHYDGAAFSLFLNSTDDQSLLLSPYKSLFTMDDFFSPTRDHHSILLIPGVLLTDYSIYPTPHIVLQSGKIRYATIAFAMRPNYSPQKIELSSLPIFKD